jgi:hypothetical protein
MNTDTIEQSILAIEPDVGIEVIAEARTKAEALKQVANAVIKEADRRMEEWIKKNRQDIRFAIDDKGHELWFYLDKDKSIKCRDQRNAFEQLMQYDMNQVVDCLSANCWKPGAVRKLLKENGNEQLFDQLFETIERERIKGEGIKPELQCVDTRYLR